MKVVGFSFIRNAVRYDYPIVESILSLLPVVDKYVIAVGNSDDATRQLVESVNNPKIKIIDTVWNDSLHGGGIVLAEETNKAFQAIAQEEADWAFYLQGDECIHENDYEAIRKSMRENLHNKKVEGLLFKYIHFYGNYNYTGSGKRWYRQEIRIIRNRKDIISWKDAQGFRFKDKTKLHVKKIDAHIYHYGWVKPPLISTQKILYFHQLHHEDFKPSEEQLQQDFDYHKIDRLKLFDGTHPTVMKNRINRINWHFEFDTGRKGYGNMKFTHKLSHFIEDLTGYRIGEYKNYILL